MPPWLELALVITAVCVPGIVLMAIRGVRSLQTLTAPDADLPRPSVLIAASAAQNLVGVAGLACAGAWALDRAGLDAPAFEALASGGDFAAAAGTQWLPGLIGALVAAAMVLGLYYGWARRTLNAQALARIESLRRSLGVSTRVLFAGMSEEVLFRFGVMTLLAWGLGSIIDGDAAIITAVALAALVFAAAHVPALVASGVRLDGTLVAGTLGLNAIAGTVFGVLFWKYGLLASMIAHAGFHLLWWPLENRYQAVAPPTPGFEWIGDGRIGEGG